MIMEEDQRAGYTQTTGEPQQFATISTCKVCGQKFETKGFIAPMLSRPVVPNICELCTEERARAEAAKERQAKILLAEEARAKKDRAWARLCPSEYRLTTESDGRTEIARLELECTHLKRILAWQYQSRGLVLRSKESGLCKTRAMWRLLRKLFNEGRAIAFYTAGSFQRRAQDEAGKYTIDAWFNTVAAVDVLFLDDLGKGFWTENTEAIFFDLAEHRTSQGLPIMVTTNYTGDEMIKGSRSEATAYTIRRLRDYCEVIVMD